jgi:hypothetical protein
VPRFRILRVHEVIYHYRVYSYIIKGFTAISMTGLGFIIVISLKGLGFRV